MLFYLLVALVTLRRGNLYVASDSMEELFASINKDGFPLELLIKAAKLDPIRGKTILDEETLPDLLELPEIRAAAQSVALSYAAKRLLNAPETSRTLLMYNWADRGLCAYPWLSWLPWLACQSEGTSHSEYNSTYSANAALPEGECYSDGVGEQ